MAINPPEPRTEEIAAAPTSLVPKLFTAVEAGELLGVSQGTIRKWIRDGELRWVDMGTPKKRSARILETDLALFITERTHAAVQLSADELDCSA